MRSSTVWLIPAGVSQVRQTAHRAGLGSDSRAWLPPAAGQWDGANPGRHGEAGPQRGLKGGKRRGRAAARPDLQVVSTRHRLRNRAGQAPGRGAQGQCWDPQHGRLNMQSPGPAPPRLQDQAPWRWGPGLCIVGKRKPSDSGAHAQRWLECGEGICHPLPAALRSARAALESQC